MNMQAQLQASIQAALDAQTPAAPAVDDTSPVASPTLPAANDDASSWKQVADVLPHVEAPKVKIKTLSEKAMLVTLKMSKMGTTKLDRDETDKFGGSHNVYKSLFSSKDNRVKKARSAYDAVYNYIKENTVPWAKGVDMINSAQYTLLMHEVRKLIATADAAVADLKANWDQEVQADLAYRTACAAQSGKGHIVSIDDYPTVEELESKYSIDIQISPVPKPNDFDPRHPVTEEDIASLQRQLDEAATQGGKHVIKQMLDPMEKAVANLSTPVADVKKFYSSIITNMVDVADRMRRANISDDVEIAKRISDLTSLSTKYAANPDILRNSQTARDAAVADISSLMGKMKGLV
jgi:DNA repair ATPase RecN